MALTKFGFIVTGSNLEPRRHRAELRSETFEMIVVGVANPEAGVAVAEALVGEGVELIELCGGFGPEWTAKVIEALAGRVPVGSVAYGPEAIAALARLFAPP